MHNKRFQDELGKLKCDAAPIKNATHKAFVDRLKQQVSSDETSSNTEDTNACDDVCSEELMKALEAKFDELFADLDDDD